MLSVIILTFNSRKATELCLNSLFAQGYKGFELIVVDNGSQDGTPVFIKENYPGARLIENKDNLGACKARNQGIVASKEQWVLCLDCDIILGEGFLEKILRLAQLSEESIGCFQPKVLQSDKKHIYSCGIYLSKERRFYDIGKNKLDNGNFSIPKYVFGVCAAAVLYRRKCLDQIKEDTGYFDERFFFLAEDVDLSWRARKKGWKALFCPEVICYHTGNSSNTSFKLRQYFCFRNRYFLIFKNDNINRIRYIAVILFYDLPRLIFLLLTNSCILKALWEIKYAYHIYRSNLRLINIKR